MVIIPSTAYDLRPVVIISDQNLNRTRYRWLFTRCSTRIYYIRQRNIIIIITDSRIRSFPANLYVNTQLLIITRYKKKKTNHDAAPTPSSRRVFIMLVFRKRCEVNKIITTYKLDLWQHYEIKITRTYEKKKKIIKIKTSHICRGPTEASSDH